jgi:hypothetical protein
MPIKARSPRPAIEFRGTALFTLLCALIPLLAHTAPGASRSDLLTEFRNGPMRGVEHIVFAARGVNPTDGHWYANFGYYAHDPNRKAYAEGAKLYRFNLQTRELTTLLADPQGGMRDPQISYDGKRILFSYRPGGTEQYHLYEINADGTALKQLMNVPPGISASCVRSLAV